MPEHAARTLAVIETSGRPTPSLHGRDREIAHLDGLIDGVCERGGALVLRGEPGIGKSALLARASGRALQQGMAVLTATGVQSETQLAFAGLHQLLRPFLGGLKRVPAPQRHALETAFGMTEGDAPDLFLIGLATLGLLAEAAGDAPLLLAIEDAQWLDGPSWDVLAFVARRLEMEPVVLLVAARDSGPGEGEESGLVELRISGLGEQFASTLLDAHDRGLSPALRSRILAEAAGNPLALIELPEAVVGRDLELPLAAPLPLTARLEQTFASRLPGLDGDTRAALLVAALDVGGHCSELLGAAERVVGHSVAIEAFLPAVSAGLGVLEDDVFRFRHPLIRSAVYQDASAPSRRRAHAALADVLLGEPDRRVWHLAAAATAADETVACELEAAAERARRRGGADVAVTALRRAADLSADDERKAHRLLTAAGLSFELGRPAKAVSLLDGVEPGKLAPAGRGRLTLLRELVDPQPFPGIARWHSMIRSAQQLATDGETELALDLLWLLGSRAWWKDPGAEARRVLVTTAESIASIDDDVRVLSLLGYAAPFERGEPVAARLAQAASQEDYATESARLLAATAVVTGAWDVAPQFLRASLGGMRSQGRLAQLPRMLVMQAMVAAQMGDWTVAMPAAEEARTLAIETGQPVWAGAADASAALAAAHRGDEDMAEALAAAAERAVPRLGASHVLALVQISRGAAALAGGHHLEAYDHLRRLFARDDPAHHWTMRWWALDDYVEAAIRTGHRPVVEPLVDELHSLAQLTPACWTHAVLDHARALLATDADAAGRFRAALEAGPEHCLFHRGRVLLSFGQWLRRQRRIESSRAPLRAAAESFDAVGATAWGARARQELRASGETARRRVPDAWDQLTPQELQIARLASEGLTNREIGLQLYLSHRTVGTHLYRLFPKLGVTSRSELRAALQEIVG